MASALAQEGVPSAVAAAAVATATEGPVVRTTGGPWHQGGPGWGHHLGGGNYQGYHGGGNYQGGWNKGGAGPKGGPPKKHQAPPPPPPGPADGAAVTAVQEITEDETVAGVRAADLEEAQKILVRLGVNLDGLRKLLSTDA